VELQHRGAAEFSSPPAPARDRAYRFSRQSGGGPRRSWEMSFNPEPAQPSGFRAVFYPRLASRKIASLRAMRSALNPSVLAALPRSWGTVVPSSVRNGNPKPSAAVPGLTVLVVVAVAVRAARLRQPAADHVANRDGGHQRPRARRVEVTRRAR
jgi:hypothetical protein